MRELITHFGIDWKLLLAQSANFLILLWILKRFAYNPILKILQKRREEIEKGIKYTQEAKIRLEEVDKERETALNNARSEALKIVSGGEDVAKKRKDDILKEASVRAETIVSDAKRLIEEEKAKMGDEVFKNAENLLELGLEKVVGKMSPEERDRALIREALKELKHV